MNNEYQKKDFFLSKDGKDLFENTNANSIKHLCVTDTLNEITKVYESKSNTYKDKEKLIEIVVGLGIEIPLWNENVTLKWRFNPLFNNYDNSNSLKGHIKSILTDAISAWGSSSPVLFSEDNVSYDFEIIMRPDNCNAHGCTLASAFFPNSELNILSLYPRMFKQSKSEQVETMIHELGHIFGLRHYFAKDSEANWRSEVFGEHYPLTIMNYGHNSTLTSQDKNDLQKLYSMVWSGDLKSINSIPIKLYSPKTQS